VDDRARPEADRAEPADPARPGLLATAPLARIALPPAPAQARIGPGPVPTGRARGRPARAPTGPALVRPTPAMTARVPRVAAMTAAAHPRAITADPRMDPARVRD